MKIWWCQEHENIGSEKRCQHGLTDRFYNLTNPAPCRMVPMRLIPDNAIFGDIDRDALAAALERRDSWLRQPDTVPMYSVRIENAARALLAAFDEMP